jgi:hypothetical protein
MGIKLYANVLTVNYMAKKIAILVIGIVVIAIVSLAVLKMWPQGQPSVTNADFMLLDGEGPNAGGEFSRELGINTIPIYLDDWSKFEPADDQWDWTDAFPDNINGYDHSVLRIGILHVLAWNPENIPTWVDKNDIDGKFREEYGEFVTEAVKQVKKRNIPIDVYLVELESNFAGHEIRENITNAWIIDWIKWEVELIKTIDPGAKIAIPLTPTEFRPKESLDNTDDRGKILLADFVKRMMEADVSFDAFGFNVASGFYDKIDDWRDLKAALDKWSAIDKEIFVWAMGYPADNIDNLPFNYPRTEGYSEEWQKEQYANSLRILLENPKVIGLSIDLYDYQEPGQKTPVHWGLIGGDRTRPETLFNRQSFDVVKEYWNDNYR